MRDVLLRRRHALEVTAIAMLPGERVVAPSEERAPQAAAARHGDDARLAPMQPGERPPIAQQPLPDGEMRGGAPLRRTHARPPPLLDSLRQRRKPVELTRLRRDLLREAAAAPMAGEGAERVPGAKVGISDRVPPLSGERHLLRLPVPTQHREPPRRPPTLEGRPPRHELRQHGVQPPVAHPHHEGSRKLVLTQSLMQRGAEGARSRCRVPRAQRAARRNPRPLLGA